VVGVTAGSREVPGTKPVKIYNDDDDDDKRTELFLKINWTSLSVIINKKHTC
jgi:hypothetical protein